MSKRQVVEYAARQKAELLTETVYDTPRAEWTFEMQELSDAIEKVALDVALPLLDGDT